jgi:RNA-directed DNA polymerase
MRMTDWYTAGANKKPKPSRLRFKLAWRSVSWNCIPAKPGSSTVRTSTATRNIRTSPLDFLGYCFRPRLVKNTRNQQLFCGFNPAVSPGALKAIRSTIRNLKLRRQTHLSLVDIAQRLNPLMRGWIEYYGRYTPSALHPLFRHVDLMLVNWARRKFKRFATRLTQAHRFLAKQARDNVDLFTHWRLAANGWSV